MGICALAWWLCTWYMGEGSQLPKALTAPHDAPWPSAFVASGQAPAHAATHGSVAQAIEQGIHTNAAKLMYSSKTGLYCMCSSTDHQRTVACILTAFGI